MLARVEADCEDGAAVLQAALLACHECRIPVMTSWRHDFAPAGMTATIVLAESHLTIETLPEHRLVLVDCTICGKVAPDRPVREMARRLGGQVQRSEIRDR